MTEAIKDKIRKLLSITTERGATEDEAANALRLAMALMAKHGISQDQVPNSEKPKAQVGKQATQVMKGYEVLTAQAAGWLYGCKIVTYNRGRAGFAFVGRPDHIDAAEETFMWLARQIEAIYKTALDHQTSLLGRTMSQEERGHFRLHFKNGCALRVYERCKAFVTDPEMVKATGSTALVVKGYFEGLMAEAQEAMDGRGFRKGRSKKIKYSESGYAAGETVKLRRETEKKNAELLSHS